MEFHKRSSDFAHLLMARLGCLSKSCSHLPQRFLYQCFQLFLQIVFCSFHTNSVLIDADFEDRRRDDSLGANILHVLVHHVRCIEWSSVGSHEGNHQA